MQRADVRRIEVQADVSFEKGQIVGEATKKAIKKTTTTILVICASVIATILFFIYGFLDHKYKQKL